VRGGQHSVANARAKCWASDQSAPRKVIEQDQACAVAVQATGSKKDCSLASQESAWPATCMQPCNFFSPNDSLCLNTLNDRAGCKRSFPPRGKRHRPTRPVSMLNHFTPSTLHPAGAAAAREAQAAAGCASRIRVRSLRGVIGSASTLTPSGRSASSIAEQIAGGAPMRPPSPPPLMPYSV
jgi:hypothetical protein